MSTLENYVLPLLVSVTGHRDLVQSEIGEIRSRVRTFLLNLKEGYPERCITVISALAEGADQLVAEVAIELSLDLLVPLPMAKDKYVEDFGSEDIKQKFELLYSQAKDVFELPEVKQNPQGLTPDGGFSRSQQYAQLGVFICAHSHILLALWDGKPSADIGGTAQVVRYHLDDVMPGYTLKTVTSQQMLIDDESDLVFHIVCSRDRPDGQPCEEFKPLDCSWYSKDADEPRSNEMPKQHKTIFQRSSEFSCDAIKFSNEIDAGKHSLLNEKQNVVLPEGLSNINRLFCIADWLAVYYQRKTLLTLRLTHFLAFLMGFMYILYSDFNTKQYFLLAFLVCFFIAAGIQFASNYWQWQRKYLDYRTLAEGLRVQFYWAAAGVRNENKSKFIHDNYLLTQDPEIGWIRNIMRVAGVFCNASPNINRENLEFTLAEWIGDSQTGQLGYYRVKAKQRSRRNLLTERLGALSLLISVLVVCYFILTVATAEDNLFSPLKIIMGSFLLLFAVREGYTYATAVKELIKQYKFMVLIFNNARSRLMKAEDDLEKRQILLALGNSAMDEHSKWLLLHRDRTLEQGEIWRMSS